MSTSPVRDRRASNNENYRPRIISTVGQRPACLVSASVTYVGNNEIYAFGGFDQYTDEVYNHVLRLNLETRQWNLVDNYGDIPGVRMGHTATLWGDKVLIFGGENEHRAYLNDLIIFDIKTANWRQPEVNGTTPRGRARHSATLYDDKLFIIGGLSGHDNNTILDDFCYLDLKRMEWSRIWRFVPRFDHTCWVWGGRIWVFGGLTEGMERVSGIWWLDPKQNPILTGEMSASSTNDRRTGGVVRQARPPSVAYSTATATPYAANSGSVQTNAGTFSPRKLPMAPGSISSLNFVSGPSIPIQSTGTHFHAFSSGCLLDFVTPANPAITTALDNSLCSLELESMRWEKLADGRDLFDPNYRWHYCTLNQEGTMAWLLGCPREPVPNHNGNNGEYLSDVLCVDLRQLGLLGNSLASEYRFENQRMPTSDTHLSSHLSGIGADLARMFDRPPETGSATDFTVTADIGDDSDDELDMVEEVEQSGRVSKPIHVHRLILEARWPHFARMIASQMAEFHSKKLHIPEPYTVVRAFLHYLYTDNIASSGTSGPNLDDVAGMLVMSNLYDMPRLRILCRNRLGRELDVEHAAAIWERAGMSGEEWLKRRAARFCLTFWGRVVRTAGFRNLKKAAMAELCAEIDTEGRVLGADELESVGGLGGARFLGGSGGGPSNGGRSRRLGSAGTVAEEADDGEDDEGMEIS